MGILYLRVILVQGGTTHDVKFQANAIHEDHVANHQIVHCLLWPVTQSPSIFFLKKVSDMQDHNVRTMYLTNRLQRSLEGVFS